MLIVLINSVIFIENCIYIRDAALALDFFTISIIIYKEKNYSIEISFFLENIKNLSIPGNAKTKVILRHTDRRRRVNHEQ